MTIFDTMMYRLGRGWRSQHPVTKGVVFGIAAFFVAAAIISIVPPAWAFSFPVGNLFVLDLGAVPVWIGTAVLVVTWWESRQGRLSSAANKVEIGAVKESLVLVERNTNSMTKTIERLAEEKGESKAEAKADKKAEDTAATLAEGVAKGIELERASVTAHAPTSAAPPTDVDGGKKPLPVTDTEATKAGKRSADALERSAAANLRVADAAEEKK